MSLIMVVAVIALVAAAAARSDSGGHGAPAPAHGGYAPPPPPSYGYPEPPYEKPSYSFDWAVKDDYSGNDFGHHETRDGYDTQGSYYVLLPDGRVQEVTYTVHGDGGFVAVVEYKGEAKHDTQYGKPPAPAYGPPAPAYGPPAPAYAPPPAHVNTQPPGHGHA